MSIKMIWAMDNSRVIGKNNELPWYLPEDLMYFRTMTEHNTIVMGRKTYESLGNKPLPNRRNIVLSKTMKSTPEVEVYPSVGDLMINCLDFWVIGGRQVYDAFMPYADELYITSIRIDVDGDTYAPNIKEFDFKSVSPLNTSVNGMKYRFLVLER